MLVFFHIVYSPFQTVTHSVHLLTLIDPSLSPTKRLLDLILDFDQTLIQILDFLQTLFYLFFSQHNIALFVKDGLAFLKNRHYNLFLKVLLIQHERIVVV